MYNFFIGDQVELIEYSIVFGQVFVLVGFTASTEYAAIGYYVALFGVLNGEMSSAPFLQLGTRYETGTGPACRRMIHVGAALVRYRICGAEGALGLPPVVVVLACDLQNVAHLKFYACL